MEIGLVYFSISLNSSPLPPFFYTVLLTNVTIQSQEVIPPYLNPSCYQPALCGVEGKLIAFHILLLFLVKMPGSLT